MVYHRYICDACGFTSSEEQGVYQCPNCGNQMRVAQETRGGDNTPLSGLIVILIIEVFLVLPICIGILSIFGIPVFIIIVWLTWRYYKNRFRNKAIPNNPNMQIQNPNTIYTCHGCGNNFYGKRPNCPHCGATLNYEN